VENVIAEKQNNMSLMNSNEQKLQEKIHIVHKKNLNLQENILTFAKISAKSKINLKGTNLLQKEEVLNDLNSDLEYLIIK